MKRRQLAPIATESAADSRGQKVLQLRKSAKERLWGEDVDTTTKVISAEEKSRLTLVERMQRLSETTVVALVRG